MAYVRGYFAADGCMIKNRRGAHFTEFTSGSREFPEVLIAHLRHHGVKGGYIRTKERGFDLQFSHRDSLALYWLMYNTGEDVSLFLPRKREKLKRGIKVLNLTNAAVA